MGLEAVVELVAVLVVGRLCLSVLPPGWPGYHEAREGGATFGASVLLGSLAWHFLPYWIPWGIALWLRWMLLPGAMRPRHELATPAGRLFDRGVLVVLIVALAWLAWRSPGASRDGTALIAPAQIVASLAVLHALLLRLRWPAPKRTVVLVVFAAVVGLGLSRGPASTLAPALLGVSWILAGFVIGRRTADRRAAWLLWLGLLAGLVLTLRSSIGV